MFYIHGEIILCITRDHFSSPFRLMVEKSSLQKKKHCFLNECFKNATTLQMCKDPSLSSTHASICDLRFWKKIGLDNKG